MYLHQNLLIHFVQKTAKAVLVSLNVKPVPAATADAMDNPYFNSRTSVAEALVAQIKY